MPDDPGLIGQIKQKLVESKQRWAREGRHLTGIQGEPGQRLPPGQREVKNWPVLDLGVQPDIRPETWHLRVDGLVETPTVWKWDDFRAQPRFQDVSDIHCVTAWSRYENLWEGVSARHILSVVKPKPEARHILFHSFDGYTTNLPLAAFDDDDVLLADTWEGKPITREHGGPVRVVVPKLYFWKSAKWVNRMEFLAEDRPGFWEERGYHNEGDPWKEQRYS
ncbi:sulfite oxidase-like oxidoreductase [Rhodocista pekingensis]|uniref:Sulfite oxidase-like oxidoreductase n=1 Tax=Rhodocista pekingensis TaxID=201185 RepID=A0ABW2KZ25_9PROT